MPQIVTKLVTAVDHPLPLTNAALIPGLTIPILTGAGNIAIKANVNLFSDTAQSFSAWLTFRIDGTLATIWDQGYTTIHIAQYAAQNVAMEIIRHLGAGQHTIELWGACDNAGPYIPQLHAMLAVHELGF